MWQIAFSLKLLGLNEFALRLPSALMGATMVFLLFRMGKIIVNSTVGYYAALLYAFANYQLEFVSGFTQLDHNDAAFIFYITASIWAWVEYTHSSNKKWIYTIGLFAGCAILTKWLVGMLVFSGWGIAIISNRESRTKLSSYIPIIKSFVTTCLVFLPWQIYTRISFPAEYKLESDYNIQHIFKALEGHTGGNWYHFDLLADQYGKLAPYLIVLAIFIFIKQVKNRSLVLAFLTFIIAPYLFFLIVKTKMPSFCIVAAPVIYLLLGNLLYEGLSLLSNFSEKIKKCFAAICLLFIISWSVNLPKVITNHELPFPHYPFRVARIVNTHIDKQVVNLLPSKDYVIFNCGGYNTTLVMFFSGMPAYGFQPEWADYAKMKKAGVKMAIFDDGKLRDYLKNDPAVFKIKRHLMLETY
jgi:4-amino-4-deoxy-L-arabinose transferase